MRKSNFRKSVDKKSKLFPNLIEECFIVEIAFKKLIYQIRNHESREFLGIFL